MFCFATGKTPLGEAKCRGNRLSSFLPIGVLSSWDTDMPLRGDETQPKIGGSQPVFLHMRNGKG